MACRLAEGRPEPGVFTLTYLAGAFDGTVCFNVTLTGDTVPAAVKAWSQVPLPAVSGGYGRAGSR